ncbi:hypothetical protein [Pseudaquabacterium pictum]|uniref:Lipoprotein n=1 Tax=Pseudaquabacterium pictum TaxID=2315236 RepID=A0A480B1Z6_9BURK|nr:hypothetical protein [Rubrivivax pictus]GCL65028.1 hypothetical protein AQPW35_41090 [Rubrivivax pictus]
MSRSTTTTRPPARLLLATPVALAIASGLLLSACGGSDDDTPAAPALVDQTVAVIDGPLRGAKVCLDLNDNDACDAGEPNATTAADGTATLTGLDPAVLAAHAVLADVPADAVDADHGVVGTAYQLKTPAGKPAVVSPLTTLVAAHIANAGGTAAAADTALAEQLGLAGSLFDNFTGKTDAAATQAAVLARLVVVTTQKHTVATADAKDAGGQALAAIDRTRVVQNALLTQLPAMAAAVPALAAASGEARSTALAAAADTLVTDSGITAANIAVVVAAAKLPPAPEAPASSPTAGVALRWFSYADAQNYQYRMFKSTAAQNTIVDGQRAFTEYRERSVGSNGAVTGYSQWGEGLSNQVRNQVYWTGSAWLACPTDFVHKATPWDAKGMSDSNYCGAFKTTNKRVARDIAGRTMADVVTEIRAWPLFDSEGDYTAWGPDPALHADKLAAVMPAGAKLYVYTGIETARPDLYGTHLANDRIVVYNAEVAAGGSSAAGSACGAVTPSNFSRFLIETSTLDQVVAANTGLPCSYSVGSNVGESRNDWYGTTLSIGDVADASYVSSTGYHVSGVKRLRVSFAPGNVANYWQCLRRASDGSPRNCTAAGSGSYRIEALGDARVLRLAGVPAAGSALTYNRIIVEREGQVWYGSRGKVQTTHQLRLDQVASEALFTALGLPAPRAAEPLTAALLQSRYLNTAGPGSYNPAVLAMVANDNTALTGAWRFDDADALKRTHDTTFFFFANGDYVMADPAGDSGPDSCGPAGLERGSIAWDAASGALQLVSIAADTNLCAGLHDTTKPDSEQLGRVVVTARLSADGQVLTVTSPGEPETRLRRISK